MSEPLPTSPTCHSDAVVKNGRTRHNKQNYKCRDCGRRFVLEPQWRAVSEEHRAIIDQLLLEKIPLAAIGRAMQVSQQWLQSYFNAKYAVVLQQVKVSPKPKHRLTVQMDELGSFVKDKDHEQWIWLAIARATREIVGSYVGDRSGKSAKSLVELFACSVSRLVQCATLIPCLLIPLPCRVHDISQWLKKLGKQATLNGSIADYANECHGSFGKPYRSPRSYKITR